MSDLFTKSLIKLADALFESTEEMDKNELKEIGVLNFTLDVATQFFYANLRVALHSLDHDGKKLLLDIVEKDTKDQVETLRKEIEERCD